MKYPTYWFFHSIARLFFKLVYKHKILYPDGHFHLKGAALIASNHTSFYDPPIIGISFNEQIAFLARKTLFDNFFLKILISRLNAYPIDKSSHNSLKVAKSLLEKGQKLVVFPEGTRSKHGRLLPFKSGVAMLAGWTNAPIIPVYIHGTFEAWPQKNRFPSFFGHKTACVFGKPFFQKEYEGKDAKQTQERITAHLQSEVLRLQTWYLAKHPHRE